MTSFKLKGASFLLTLYLLFTLNSLKGQSREQINQPTNSLNLSFLSSYKTNGASIPVKDIASKYFKGEFKKIKQSVLNAGIPKQFYWIHFSITNPLSTEAPLVIDIDNSRLNEIELFSLLNDSIHSLGKLGDFYKFNQRAILHKNFIYQDTLSPHQKKEYFLFANQVGHTFILPVKIFSPKKFRSATFTDYLLDGVTYGILVFVAILSLLFFLSTKYYLYLYYCLYIVTAIVWFLGYFGLGYQYIWGNYPSMNTLMSPVMACLNIVFNLQICQILLKLSRTNKLLNLLANIGKYALLTLAIFPICINLNNYGYGINHAYLILFLFTILFAMMIVSYSVIAYALKGVIAAKVYLIASLLKAGSIVNLALLELGLLPAIYNMEGFLQVGIFIETTLLTLALALRYTNFKSKTFAKVIEAHENERALISKEIHDGISSALTGINYGIKNFTRDAVDLPADKAMQLNKIFDELNKVQLEARSISHNTMPDYVKSSSISEIVEKYIAELQSKIKSNSDGENFVRISFSANEESNYFPEVVKLNIFRIIQEILTNILKHSGASKADIVFSFSKKEMLIIAEDNGLGFNYAEISSGNGMGINNIRTRVNLLDGNIEIKSPAYKQNSEQNGLHPNLIEILLYGTFIKIRIPYRNNLFNTKPGYDY